MPLSPDGREEEKSAMTIGELAARVSRARQLLHRLASDPSEPFPEPVRLPGSTRTYYDVALFDAYWAAREAGIKQGRRSDLEKKRATEPEQGDPS